MKTSFIELNSYSINGVRLGSFFRSYGVILWELLTGEIPYKDVDSSAIIWGVGSDSLSLPIPKSCPEGFKLLFRQCWCVAY